jgi:hypothetical protein
VCGFRVDAALDRRAPVDDVRLCDAERLSRCDGELLAHEIDSCHGLGDGVLHLQPRVHLEEVEVVADEQALDRPRAGVVDVAADGCRELGHPFA